MYITTIWRDWSGTENSFDYTVNLPGGKVFTHMSFHLSYRANSTETDYIFLFCSDIVGDIPNSSTSINQIVGMVGDDLKGDSHRVFHRFKSGVPGVYRLYVLDEDLAPIEPAGQLLLKITFYEEGEALI